MEAAISVSPDVLVQTTPFPFASLLVGLCWTQSQQKSSSGAFVELHEVCAGSFLQPEEQYVLQHVVQDGWLVGTCETSESVYPPTIQVINEDVKLC